jgi:hypothetical protein
MSSPSKYPERILVFLADGNWHDMLSMANAANTTQTQVFGIMASFKLSGLVEEATGPGHAPFTMFRITDQGRAALLTDAEADPS